ncbi:MAG: serine/threonine protein kinase, partial [Anaerolineales bacterium]|nr:serine/threonine protein kinase [Anaerolineales bacterium]
MSQPTWIGQTLNGRYRIEELLGQGGMSAVYKATDPNLRRVVAIKLIHSHLSNNPNFVRRFEEEAAAVAQLRHPNIVQVFDFNHDGETYYIVFEFVPGETLQARLARLSKNGRTLPLNETLQIAASMGDALDYAHKRGLVHRDIKPA